MDKDIITIKIDVFEAGTAIKIDRTSEDLGAVLHGLIAGSLKSLYNHQKCKLIADLLAVIAGLKKDVRITRRDFPFVPVAEDVYNGVRAFFGSGATEAIRLCCRCIYDELQVPAALNVYSEDSGLNID